MNIFALFMASIFLLPAALFTGAIAAGIDLAKRGEARWSTVAFVTIFAALAWLIGIDQIARMATRI